MGYVYASNNTDTALIRYPGVSNSTDVIPASAHIHYNHICFENSNLVNTLSIPGCPSGVTINTNDNIEPDPHCPYMQKVVDGTEDYKTCEDISCWISFKGNRCPETHYVCGTIYASRMTYDSNDTGSGSNANQFNVQQATPTDYNEFHSYHDWNLHTIGENGRDEQRNIQLVSKSATDAIKCGVFGYSYPNFDDLSSKLQKKKQ